MANTKTAELADLELFKSKLLNLKKAIDSDIAAYCAHIQNVTSQQYGPDARLATDAFLDILKRGGKRIRGALTVLGYEMSGGTNRPMILQAARAIEMLHAYILIIDDIQDRSELRRGGPTAHAALREYHAKKGLAGDSGHFGLSIALNASLSGAHAAQMIMANIDAPEHLRLSALSIINRTMVITAHGQTSDIMHEAVGKVNMDEINKVMEWKTSQYSILNPLHVGMVLAGADCHATDAITAYATNIGKAYQISDDILDTFGKDGSLDDIRDGKQTIVIAYALEKAEKVDREFLVRILGNDKLTLAEFERCRKILTRCGALQNAQDAIKNYVEQANSSLGTKPPHWAPEGTHFLRGLAEYILTRSS